MTAAYESHLQTFVALASCVALKFLHVLRTV